MVVDEDRYLYHPAPSIEEHIGEIEEIAGITRYSPARTLFEQPGFPAFDVIIFLDDQDRNALESVIGGIKDNLYGARRIITVSSVRNTWSAEWLEPESLDFPFSVSAIEKRIRCSSGQEKAVVSALLTQLLTFYFQKTVKDLLPSCLFLNSNIVFENGLRLLDGQIHYHESNDLEEEVYSGYVSKLLSDRGGEDQKREHGQNFCMYHSDTVDLLIKEVERRTGKSFLDAYLDEVCTRVINDENPSRYELYSFFVSKCHSKSNRSKSLITERVSAEVLGRKSETKYRHYVWVSRLSYDVPETCGINLMSTKKQGEHRDYWQFCFSIFARDEHIHMLLPRYTDEEIDSNKVGVRLPGDQDETARLIQKETYECLQLLVYTFSREKPSELLISYKDEERVIDLKQFPRPENKKQLALTTLFKEDFPLIDTFYEYYVDQGVEHFYLYYNGRVDKEVEKVCDKENLTLVEWNYRYFNTGHCKFGNHAQNAQMNDALYRYGKGNYQYMAFCDLDEYMYIPGSTVSEYLASNPVDKLGFECYWSKVPDGRAPRTFPNLIETGKPRTFPYRSKCVLNPDKITFAGVHDSALTDPQGTIETDKILFHFYDWSGKRREYDFTHLYDLSAPHKGFQLKPEYQWAALSLNSEST